MSDSLRPYESQHARPPCPSPAPRVHSDSCPLSQWCHPAISSSVLPFSSFPQSLPASESFPMSPIWNQSVVPRLVLTVASWPTYGFLSRQVKWSGFHISWRIPTVCCDPHSHSARTLKISDGGSPPPEMTISEQLKTLIHTVRNSAELCSWIFYG